MSNRTSGKTPTAAEREAQKFFKNAAPEVSEYEQGQQDFRANRERLKAERLARKTASAETSGEVTRPKPPKGSSTS
ncbi:hypothetical protein JJB99_24105 [Bradyrhizobium diazoefficiens]|uniref:hypothetical protein n=1 Tax=Bradyrhizobium diazoefficiens TaxID=1355477 RepID=UPI00190DB935|nr:hypothetical protein [Bradyrhizobium diazoefficiens]QQO12539.1 hypothetical protein JJB99_24105 [Bradyrhizobium diazoefficiens]